MSRPYIDISINQCEESKEVIMDVVAKDSGSTLKIPVYLYNVWPCRKMVVGVTLFINGVPYATKVKKIFTGGRRWFCHRIACIFVGDFMFLMTDNCNDEISFKVLSHYIF